MSRLVSKIVFMICLIVFVGSAAYLLNYVLGTTGASKDFQALKTTEDESKVNLWALYDRNPDFRGWLDLEGTKIDYPVMQSDPEDPEFYLHLNFDKKWSNSGTPFIDSLSCDDSSNWLIYGHNMKIGTMFHDLLEYEDKEFWESHQTFKFDRLLIKDPPVDMEKWDPDLAEENRGEYEVVAACYSKIRSGDSKEFKYYNYFYIADEETFDEYVKGIKSESCYDTGAELSYGDQLVTLSTCAYHTDDGRFYIVGRRIN